jgi:hypothetical protein
VKIKVEILNNNKMIITDTNGNAIVSTFKSNEDLNQILASIVEQFLKINYK